MQMFMFDTTDAKRLAISAIGALLVSTICVVGAVGPAKANRVNAAVHHSIAGGAAQHAVR